VRLAAFAPGDHDPISGADPLAQRGRQNLKTRHGEHLEVLPGFLPPACCPKVPCEQGRAVGLKRLCRTLISPKDEKLALVALRGVRAMPLLWFDRGVAAGRARWRNDRHRVG
jgi:hypothetical protein